MSIEDYDRITSLNPFLSTSNQIINVQNEMILHFFDMGFVASTLEDSIILSNPIISNKPGKLREVEESEYEEDKAFVQKYHVRNEKIYKKLVKQAKSRRELFRMIRDVYPEFCQDIDKKIPEEDYQIYMKQQRKLRQLIVRQHTTDYQKRVSDLALERKDKISELIDSEDFSKACMIEDKFMLSEFRRYLELLRLAPNEVQNLHKRHNIPCGEIKESAEGLVKTSIEGRDARILKIKQILELFDKMKTKQYIQFPDKDDE